MKNYTYFLLVKAYLLVMVVIVSCTGEQNKVEEKQEPSVELKTNLKIVDNKNVGLYKVDSKGTPYTFYWLDISMPLDENTYIPMSDFVDVKVEYQKQQPIGYNIQLNENGTSLLTEWTTAKANIAMVVDGKIIMSAPVQEPITDGLLQVTLDNHEVTQNVIEYLEGSVSSLAPRVIK